MRNFNDHERKFEQVWKFAWVVIVGTLLLCVATFAGLVFVVIKLLTHFGVL